MFIYFQCIVVKGCCKNYAIDADSQDSAQNLPFFDRSLLHMTYSMKQDILHGRSRVTADTSVRLGRYFGVSDRYFLNLQDDIDIRNINSSMKEELNKIQKKYLERTQERTGPEIE